MSSEGLADRLKAVEALTKLFRLERIVHLTVTALALMLLLGNAAFLIVRREAGAAELTLLFGSCGLIGYSANRLLFMWNQALRVIAMQSLEKSP